MLYSQLFWGRTTKKIILLDYPKLRKNICSVKPLEISSSQSAQWKQKKTQWAQCTLMIALELSERHPGHSEHSLVDSKLKMAQFSLLDLFGLKELKVSVFTSSSLVLPVNWLKHCSKEWSDTGYFLLLQIPFQILHRHHPFFYY